MICPDPFCQLPNDGHTHLRDADRVLAHSYASEVYRRPTYQWYRPSRGEQLRNAAECLAFAAAALLGGLVIWGLLFALLLGVK